MSAQPFVVIRPDGLAFHFNEDGPLAIEAAMRMSERLNEIVHEYLPWNQGWFGPFASVEMRAVPESPHDERTE